VVVAGLPSQASLNHPRLTKSGAPLSPALVIPLLVPSEVFSEGFRRPH
jgi:hypothetical protein